MPQSNVAYFRVGKTADRIGLLAPRKQWYTERGVSDVTEAFGFHGTSPSAVASILSLVSGQFLVRNGSAYGEGIYLASTTNLADGSVATSLQKRGSLRILICRFIKGRSKNTSASCKTTNPLEHLTGGYTSRGIHVVWWPNANTDIVVTHVICLGDLW